jgi:4-amino-4-deoxychorismate lyase
VLRGDGIFETMHVRHGRVWLFDEHVARMVGSAARLGLALPASSSLRELVADALAGWGTEAEGALRLVCTRGTESGGPVTVFVVIGPVSAGQRHGRRDGVAVVTASLGVPATARPTAPWLLGGAKTLSYAVNMASLRWAEEQGADDVLWVSTDGYALEGPTSTLVWLDGGTLWTVPVEQTGILPGTTARWLLDHAAELGFEAGEKMIRPAELAAAQGVWLLSSVRGAAEVRTLDGVARKPAAETGAILELLGFPL